MEQLLESLLNNFSELKQKQELLITKIDTLVSMNHDLINANLKNCGIKTNGVSKPLMATESKQTDSLFYGVDNDSFYVYGSTYDVKDKIKGLGGKWDKTNSRWTLTDCSEEMLNDTFPTIVKKQGSNKCLIDD